MTNETLSTDPISVGGPLLLTINQVAALLNLGRTKTYEIVRSGTLKSYKIGSRRLIRREDVDRYVDFIVREQGETGG